MPFVLAAFWQFLCLLQDAVPRKMKESQRHITFIFFAITASVVFGIVFTLNIYAAKDKIDEEWVFVGPMKFSVVRLISTFGMNTVILCTRFSVNAKFRPAAMLFVKNTELMVKMSIDEDIK